MEIRERIAMVIGIFAVILYALGYLQRKRRSIIILNVSSKILYITQYILLGAFAGAALDIAGAISSIIAERKNSIPFIKKHTKLFVIIIDAIIVVIGVVLTILGDKYGLLSLVGVLLHTSAFWIDDEKKIRRVSFIGSPFWLAYNFLSTAYSSCIGDILSMVSIGIAMVRYGDFKKNKAQN
ncbi:MAG: YgjV family protein [Clostridia bacterium]|nr:YgjV family protein [Clostridia bacterium]